MGLYRIPIHPEKVESIPGLMESMGFPIIRTEIQDNGVHYFCVNPKRTRKNWSFWISLESDGAPRFFMCGLSRLSRQIVGSLTFEGVFERSD